MSEPLQEPEVITARLGRVIAELEAVMRRMGISEDEIADARRRGEEDAQDA